MAKDKIIDGNEVIRQMKQEKAQYNGQGYGSVIDNATGKILAEVNGEPGVHQPPSAFIQNQPVNYGIPKDLPAVPDDEAIYKREEYEGGGGSYGPTFSPQELSQDENYSDLNSEELEEARTEHLYDAGNISNYMEKMGMSSEDVFNMMPEEFSKKDLDMFFDARKVNNQSDSMKIDDITSMFLDKNNLDHKIFYETGKMVECGGECLDRQEGYRNQAQEYEDSMLKDGDFPMSWSDERMAAYASNKGF